MVRLVLESRNQKILGGIFMALFNKPKAGGFMDEFAVMSRHI